MRRPADEAVFFSVKSLRASVAESSLGPPKSASEGAGRDRTWLAIIPSSNGTVQSVTAKKLVVLMQPFSGATRKQTYTLKILPFIGDTDENLALHAISAFGSDTPDAVIGQRVSELVAGDSRRSSAASETLRLVANEPVLKCLIEAAASQHHWVLATLGRLPAALVKPAIASAPKSQPEKSFLEP